MSFDADKTCARYLSERAADSCRDAAAGAARLRSSISLYWQGEDADLFSAVVKAWREEALSLAEDMESLSREILLAVDAAESNARTESHEKKTVASGISSVAKTVSQTMKTKVSGTAASGGAAAGAVDAANRAAAALAALLGRK